MPFSRDSTVIWVEFTHLVSYHLACYTNPNPTFNPNPKTKPNPNPNPELCKLCHKMCELYLFRYNNRVTE